MQGVLPDVRQQQVHRSGAAVRDAARLSVREQQRSLLQRASARLGELRAARLRGGEQHLSAVHTGRRRMRVRQRPMR